VRELSTLNPLRTASHFERLAGRKADLRAALEPILEGNADFIWEIGCGHGHFLTAYALAHQEACCIGIDIASERIARALRKRDRAKLTHLHFLQAEATLFLEALPATARFSTLFIIFPDPWPKLRHHKHRILQPEFLTAAAAHATPGCQLCFRTDHLPYFQSALGVTRSHPAWRIAEEPWPFEQETVFQSRAASFHSFIARRS
jgi:tRNA (guanine-N7-)-methyltransferase